MSSRVKVALVTTIVLGTLFAMLVHAIDQRAFIHVYTYNTATAVDQHGIQVAVDFQPMNPIRNEIPERVEGPPYSLTLRVKCEQGIQSIFLKRLIIERRDGSSEICSVDHSGGQPKNSLAIASSRIIQGKWREHTHLIATFAVSDSHGTNEVEVRLQLTPRHKRLLNLFTMV